MQQPQVSVRSAIARGFLMVTLPVFLLLLGPAALVFFTVRGGSNGIAWVCVALVVGFVLAWLWWSVSLPRWRLWALERVDDVAKLYQTAQAAGLTWPRGHFFEKTEIKSAAHRQREYELELLYYLRTWRAEAQPWPPEVYRAADALATALQSNASPATRSQLAATLHTLLAAPFTRTGHSPQQLTWLYRTQPLVLALGRYLERPLS